MVPGGGVLPLTQQSQAPGACGRNSAPEPHRRAGDELIQVGSKFHCRGADAMHLGASQTDSTSHNSARRRIAIKKKKLTIPDSTRRSPRMVASAVTDDDDFVQPPALGQPKTSGLLIDTDTRKSNQDTAQPIRAEPPGRGKRTNVGRWAVPKSAIPSDHNLAPISEEVPDIPKGKILCRCVPKDVIEAIGCLDQKQKERVHAMGWGTFLEMTLDAVESRELYMCLLDRVDVHTMMLNVLPNIVLPLNKPAVHTVLGVPSGSRSPPKKSYKEISISKKQLAAAIGVSVAQLSIEKLKDHLKNHHDDELSMRCFFIIVFNRLLFCTTSHGVASADIERTMDFENFKEVDWQQAILNVIKTAANNWQQRTEHHANPSMSGCPLFLLIYYLDNLDHPLNLEDRVSLPRTKLFHRRKIELLTKADKCVDRAGCIKYGNLRLLDPTGSVYEGIISPSGVNPTSTFAGSQETTRSEHTSPLDGIIQMPSLGELVKEFICQVPPHLSDDFSKIVTTFDQRVHANQVIIQQCQQDTKDLILNFSNEIKKLFIKCVNTCTEGVESEGGPCNQIPVGLVATSSTNSQDCIVLDEPQDGVPMVGTAVASPPSSTLPSSPIIGLVKTKCPPNTKSKDVPLLTTMGDIANLGVDTLAQRIDNSVSDDHSAGRHCVQPNLNKDVQPAELRGAKTPDASKEQPVKNQSNTGTGSGNSSSSYAHLSFLFSFDNGAFDDFNETQDVTVPVVTEAQEPQVQTPGTIKTPNAKQNIQETIWDKSNAATGAQELPQSFSFMMDKQIHSQEPLVQTPGTTKIPDETIWDDSNGARGDQDPPLSLPSMVDKLIFNLEGIQVNNDHIVCTANTIFPATEQTDVTATKHAQVNDLQDEIGSSQNIDAQDGHDDLASTVKEQDASVKVSHPVLVPRRAQKRTKILAGISQSNVLSASKKRRRQNPQELVSPSKLVLQTTLPDPRTTIKLRDTICAQNSPYDGTVLMHFHMVPYTGKDIKGSFQDGSDTEAQFLEDCQSLNPEELGKSEANKVFYMDLLVPCIRRYLPKPDFQRIKMINLVMHHRDHFSVYCINFEQKRIDIVDSIDYKTADTLFTDHHDTDLMDLLMSRLSDGFQKISTRFPIFRNWRRVRIVAPVMKQKNDCAACTMFYLQYYDGSSKKLLRELEPNKVSELRCGMLHYMVFHPTNSMTLPPEIERFRQPGPGLPF